MTLASKPYLAALFAGALLLSTTKARAEDAEMRTAARDLATQGAQAFEAGRYAEASDLLRRAYELVQAPSIALLRARSLAKQGQLLEAIDLYEQTSRSKLADDAPEAFAQAVQTARTEADELRHRLPRLKLTLLGESGGPSQVTIDDKPVPAVLLGVERPINPGQHVIVVQVAGLVRATRELAMVESETYRVELEVGPVKPVEKPVVAVVPSERPVAESSHSGPPLRTLGYVGLGVGAVGLGIGTITGLAALRHKSNLDDACKPQCPASSADEIDSFRSNRTISWISYGVGIAAAATGVVLLAVGKPEREHVAIRALPGGLTIGGRL
jgi:hypothetical protein